MRIWIGGGEYRSPTDPGSHPSSALTAGCTDHLGLSFLMCKMGTNPYLMSAVIIITITVTIAIVRVSYWGEGASYLFMLRYRRTLRRRMLRKLPRDMKTMDKSNNLETWTSWGWKSLS